MGSNELELFIKYNTCVGNRVVLMGMFCIVHECQCSVLVGAYLYNSGSVFYDAFSETRLYSVDDWVTSE
jgi:hypothetical protein